MQSEERPAAPCTAIAFSARILGIVALLTWRGGQVISGRNLGPIDATEVSYPKVVLLKTGEKS